MILIVIIAGLIEMVINYFFNKKIYYVTQKNSKKAAINGSIATFLFSTLVVGLASLIGFTGWYEVWWLTIIYTLSSAVSIALGNYVSTIFLFSRKELSD